MIRFATVIYFLGRSLWVGGLSTLAILVAPVIFKNAPSRKVAGEIFGAALRTFSYVEIVCAILVSGGGIAIALAARPLGGWELVRVVLLGTMIVVFLSYTFYVHPTAHTVRAECGDLSIDPANDGERVARERFDTLHKWSERLVGANIFIGLALLILSAAILQNSKP